MDEDLVKAVLDGTHDGVFILGAGFKVEYVNARACDILGRGADEIVGRDLRELVPENVAKKITKRAAECRSPGRGTFVFRLSTVTADGAIRAYDVRTTIVDTGAPPGKMVCHILDITEHEVDKRVLKESELRHRKLVETMTNGLSIDDPEGVIVFVNRAFCDMLARSREELVGHRWVEFTTISDPDFVAKKHAARRAGVSERYELEWVTKTGTTVPTVVSATPLFNADDEFIGTLAVVTDITEQKETERTHQFYIDLLTHDIANQLQVIITAAGLLDSDLPASYMEDARDTIMDAVDRCNRLITKVKRAGELRHIPLQHVDLVPVLYDRVMTLEKIYDVKVEVGDIDEHVVVVADILLGELIWNLLENAAKHNPKKEKRIWIDGEMEDGYYRLRIADNGPGISRAKKKKLFQHRRGSGGIGLMLVSQMAAKYGGKIEVTDRVKGKPSRGACFVLTLRLAE